MEEVLEVTRNRVFPEGSPQAARCQSAVLHSHSSLPPGADRWELFLLFIKLPQCAESCMEQGCGWSQRVCPQKAMATWRGGRWASLSPFKVHSSQPTPVSAPEVLLEPVDKDLGKDSI